VAHSSRTQRVAREQIARLAARGLSPEPLAARIVAAIQQVIPGDGYRLFCLDPTTRLVNRLLAASDNDGWARLEWLRDFYLATDPISYIEHQQLTRLDLPVVTVHMRQDYCLGYRADVLGQVSPRDHTRAFHELQSPVGGALLLTIPARGRWIAALQLYRRETGHPFTEDDVTLVRSLLPEIGGALAASLARERGMTLDGAGPDASGVLVLSPDYRVTFATPSAEAWLQAMRDADRSGHEPLPTPVWSALAGLRASGGSPAGVVLAPVPQGTVRIEASSAGPDGSVAVVLAPARPPPAPAVPEAWDLTRQERRVVELLVRGYSNREIARALSVTENTIEWHLRHAYDKLDVRTRSQLLARFFRETWGPSLSMPEDDGLSE
jgi:DNA-binding CsgD family transcriptional regulator